MKNSLSLPGTVPSLNGVACSGVLCSGVACSGVSSSGVPGGADAGPCLGVAWADTDNPV